MSAWLSIVGIGEDGRTGLSSAACTLIDGAKLVVGGRRHLDLAAPIAAETLVWPSPITDALPHIFAHRGEPVCVLASGDPFFYGVGTLLSTAIAPEEFVCLPAPSSFSLVAARLGWSQQTCRFISLHGRDLRRVIPHLQPRARIVALTWDETTPGELATLLRTRGCGASRLHVLEAMGGPRERRRSTTAETFDLNDIAALNVVAIEVESAPGAPLIPLAPGLPDEWFEHDGQITKREIRAITLSALRPFRGAHLWDVGSGSGSVAIEWALADPQNRATAIEMREDRAARIARNAARLGVPDITVVTGRAPEVFGRLASPDAIFIGGGGGEQPLIEAARAALPAGGRLVVNAVTIETQARLVDLHSAAGGELTSIAIAHAEPLGRFHGWRAAMQIVQWAWTKL